MRHFLICAFFVVILIIAAMLLFRLQITEERLETRLTLPKMSSEEKTMTPSKPTRGLTVSAPQPVIAEPKKTINKPVYYYSYTTTPPEPKKSAMHFRSTSQLTSSNEIVSNDPAAKKMSEDILKYVLFTINYDTHINAGETESLQLIMSPKSALTHLEKILKNKNLQEKQINSIEKIQKQYKYVSATLLAEDKCLRIEKTMPEGDKIYLHSINESVADEVWQWDLTAPETPTVATCNLSLFIRFCFNQDDCISSVNPDKTFEIFIHITPTHRIYTWFTGLGNIAHYGTAITGLIGVLIGIFIWIKKRTSKKRGTRR